MQVKEKHSKTKIFLIEIALIILIIMGIGYFAFFKNSNNILENNSSAKENLLITKGLCDFDFKFLKKEKSKNNIIYSPLSIKYALKIMEESSTGNAKKQISKYFRDYELPKYNSNDNLSIINCLCAKDTLEKNIKEDYINILRSKYNTDVIFGSLQNSNNIKMALTERTSKLINDTIQEIDSNEKIALINNLAINMEWKEKFIFPVGTLCEYSHENVRWAPPTHVSYNNFDDEKQLVSGIEINASINNYDIIKELGESKIRQTVESEYRKWLNETPGEENKSNEDIKQFIDKYIEEIKLNYHREDCFSKFQFYIDDNVKVFAKDLREYDGINLQYIGIMPTKETLDSYIKNTNKNKIENLIGSLKSIKHENFKEGVVTIISGFIPKFKFDYKLDLVKNLKDIGIEDIFESGKANMMDISEDNTLFVETINHKTEIEFSEDGIKTANNIEEGAIGGFLSFEYKYDVPIEKIDLTFNKPYMFIIRDKNTGEILYTGAIYKPTQWENRSIKNSQEKMD